MTDFDTYLKNAVDAAAQQISQQTVEHQKRMEFWLGYKSAMEEIRDHPEFWPQQQDEAQQ